MPLLECGIAVASCDRCAPTHEQHVRDLVEDVAARVGRGHDYDV
jgi:hypothetical protein